MNSLLNAVRLAAQREDHETASLGAGDVPSLSASARAEIAAAILRAQAKERLHESKPERAAGLQLHDAVGSRRSMPTPVRRARRNAYAIGGSVTVMLAAAAFVLWGRPTIRDGALPDYFVFASGGVAELRGVAEPADLRAVTTAPVQRLRTESSLRVVCRPDLATVGPLAVRTFFVQRDQIEEITPAVQIAATGAVELRVAGFDLVPRHSGRADLLVVVGRPADVRTVDLEGVAKKSQEKSRSGTEHAGRRWLQVPLDLLATP